MPRQTKTPVMFSSLAMQFEGSQGCMQRPGKGPGGSFPQPSLLWGNYSILARPAHHFIYFAGREGGSPRWVAGYNSCVGTNTCRCRRARRDEMLEVEAMAMEVPLELAFKDVQRTDLIDEFVQEKLEKLEKVCDHIVSCRLTVEKPQRHQHSARLVVRVPPGHEIVAKRESSTGDMHEQLITVLNDVFEAAHRQLQALVDRQQGLVKRHPEKEAMALVVRFFREDGYGFLRTADDTEIYFHRNSVLHDDFDRLEVGTGVRYEVEEGEKGPQATTVELVEKRGPNYVPPEEQVLETPLSSEARGR